ncbi:sensor histidine kinase [Streptomyces sp. NPDC050738]|uniref:sensor histidine kinase n=1 Tax=Streptomyces sp. NPDC050738 TaxID=3154744 RepID=UPI003436BC7B
MTKWVEAGRRNFFSGSAFGPAADPFWLGALRQWRIVIWVLFGIMAAGLMVPGRPGGYTYGALAVLAVVVLAYAAVDRYPDNRVLRPHGYLLILSLGLGALAYLAHNSYAALFIVTLPHFWLYGRTMGVTLSFMGLTTAFTLVANGIRQSWSANYVASTVVSTLIVVAVGGLMGVWLHAVVGQSNERARLLAELKETQAALSEAHQRQGADEERQRIAREIHDTLAQGFASIIVHAEAARSGLTADPATSVQQLRSIENTARENLAEARVLVGSEQHSRLAAGTVAQTLRRTLDRFAEDTGLLVDADLADVTCDQPTRIALLRCTQESLSNIRKHAAASTVSVLLVQEAHGVELEITDDGRGFVYGRAQGFGLDGMRKRLAEFGGELTVTSSLGDGTRVLAMIPTEATA